MNWNSPTPDPHDGYDYYEHNDGHNHHDVHVHDVDDLLRQHHDTSLLGHVDTDKRRNVRGNVHLHHHPRNRLPRTISSQGVEGGRLD